MSQQFLVLPSAAQPLAVRSDADAIREKAKEVAPTDSNNLVAADEMTHPIGSERQRLPK